MSRNKLLIIRDLDDELWQRLVARATAEGSALKTVILRLLRAYAEGKDGTK